MLHQCTLHTWKCSVHDAIIFIIHCLTTPYPNTAELLFTVCHVYSNVSRNNTTQEGKFEVLMAVTTKISVFCDEWPCCLVEAHQHFNGMWCLHLQPRRQSTINRNISKLLSDYMASHPIRQLLWVSWDVSRVTNSLYLICSVLPLMLLLISTESRFGNFCLKYFSQC